MDSIRLHLKKTECNELCLTREYKCKLLFFTGGHRRPVYEVCAEVNVLKIVLNSDAMYGYFTLVIVGLLKDFFSLDGYQSNSASSGLMSSPRPYGESDRGTPLCAPDPGRMGIRTSYKIQNSKKLTNKDNRTISASVCSNELHPSLL